MKPAAFAYHAPTAVAEAVELLASHDGEAKPLAGGQSLVPLLNLRLATPPAVVDLNRIEALAFHRVEPDALVVGALCRHRDIELDPAVRGRCAAIADAIGVIGHVAIRNRGTIVGSLAHADPAAEWPALALLLDASVRAVGPAGERWLRAEELFAGFLTTALDPDEIMTEVRFDLPPGPATSAEPAAEPAASGGSVVSVGSAFVELARRHGDFAMVGVAALIQLIHLSDAETITDARIALIGVGTCAVRVTEAERALVGERPGRSAFAEAAATAARSVDPPSDVHAPASYRRRLAGVLTRRALELAAARAMPGARHGVRPGVTA